jgi:hypothetical protein
VHTHLRLRGDDPQAQSGMLQLPTKWPPQASSTITHRNKTLSLKQADVSTSGLHLLNTHTSLILPRHWLQKFFSLRMHELVIVDPWQRYIQSDSFICSFKSMSSDVT